MMAGRNTNILGSDVAVEHDQLISAGQDLTIAAAQNTFENFHYEQRKKSGLMSGGGGLSISIGTQENGQKNRSVVTQAAPSTVGSIQGDLRLIAGNDYVQTGSNVLALNGDIDILGRNVTIQEAREARTQTDQSWFKKTGLTIGVSNPVVSLAQTASDMAKAAGRTSDGRMKLLAAATVGLGGLNTYTDHVLGKNPADSLNISISFGTSETRSSSTHTGNYVAGSNITASGNVTVAAIGARENATLLVQGSNIQAQGNVSLYSNGDLLLQAGKNSQTQHSTESSRGASIGVGISVGGNAIGPNLTLGFSKVSGRGDGEDTVWSNTHVSAGESLTLVSSRDTTLRGAVAAGKQVSADVGANLLIESLQDASNYKDRSSNLSGSISVGATGITGGGIGGGKTKIDSNYLSVQEQSGIRAGDDGFLVHVKGDTTLIAGAVTSTEQAVLDGLDRFKTGGQLRLSDLENKAEYSASGMQLSAGYSTQLGQNGATKTTPDSSFGFGLDSGNVSSVTQSSISGIAGNLEARTGDVEAGLKRIFDKDKVKDNVKAQIQITQEFGKQAPKAWANYSEDQYRSLLQQASNESEVSKREALLVEAGHWTEGGAYRIAGHGVIGAFAGGVGGAMGSLLSASTMPEFGKLIDKTDLPDTAKQALSVVGSATLGSIAGYAGAGMAFNTDANNRLLHPDEIVWLEKNARLYADIHGLTEEEALAQLAAQAYRQVQYGAEGSSDRQAYAFLRTAGQQMWTDEGQVGYLFFATPEQKKNSTLYSSFWNETADFYIGNGLQIPGAARISLGADRDAQIRDRYGDLTIGAGAVAGALTAAGMAPTLISWALVNPEAAVQIGLISAETGLAIQTGAVTPISIAESGSGSVALHVNKAVSKGRGSKGSLGAVKPVEGLPALRQAYVNEVKALEDVGLNMRVAGATPEQVARQLHQMRRDLGVEYKGLTPELKLEEIYARNLKTYGDKLGPSVDGLRARGKSWEQIINSASRPGGTDLGY